MIKSEKEEAITFKLIMKKFLEGVSEEVGKQTFNLGITYFTGGIENINNLVRSIKKS